MVLDGQLNNKVGMLLYCWLKYHMNVATLCQKNSILIHIEDYDDGDDSILIYKGSNCDMEGIAFVNKYDTGVEKYDDKNFFGDDWEWYQRTPFGDNDDVPGPPINGCYNRRHGLKPRVEA